MGFHSWAHIHGVPTTMFRFFTVYRPWGRPDMAYFKFTRAILAGQPIDICNHGDMWRDFTYVDLQVRAIALLIDCRAPADRGPPARLNAIEPPGAPGRQPVARRPWRVVNIGNSDKVRLLDFIDAIERCLATRSPPSATTLDIQPGDVPRRTGRYQPAAAPDRAIGRRPSSARRAALCGLFQRRCRPAESGAAS